MGNAVIWKPASSAMLSAYYIMKLLEEAGLPPGVINFVPGDAGMISDKLLAARDLAGVHFTGSTAVFNNMWKTIGASMSRYKSYPRIVGETGGKDFIVAHASAASGRALGRDRPGRLRVPGPEMLRGEQGLHPRINLAGSARSHRRDHEGASHRRCC